MSIGPPNSDENPSTSTNLTSSDSSDLDLVTETAKGESNYDPHKVKKVFDGEKWRESTRTFLAIALLLNIALTQLSVILYLFIPNVISLVTKDKNDDSKEKDLNRNLVKLSNSTFVYVVDNDKEDKSKDSRELITLIWTSQVTLVGGALGFYFAASKEKQ
ncbi:hypothetical protein ANSO36C_35710 [Nostoc cf. commune SO-36]|uniref:Uncharacterized protein n=1 Tax=Nostoc cf. commune SO-36 TaxID=449208 RepID=A0ABN6Q4P5_NOSCO|nr:hypothetical protein [Nostoc commune]BDI17769.1 hypothetical protein ANSO36C_35710 [Nostoc cf. commune SO-36]